MNYPFWDIPVGYGPFIGWIAAFHVFISHFAIGGGLYLVVTETIARKKNDQAHLDFLQGLTKFFVLTTLVMGALTGVGIWFIIGLLTPAATEVLIHNFVWGWATEWTFFMTEISAAILYYYGWKKMSAKHHLIVGWIYFFAAWMSLFVINGIITFMLTPGSWLETGSFWAGFFNPTHWPSLVFRTGVCVMLAGVFSLFVASFKKSGDVKKRLIRLNAVWGLVGLVIMIPSFYWYWRSIPPEIIIRGIEYMETPYESFMQAGYYAGGALLLLLVALMIPRRYPFILAILLMACGFMFFSKFEWFRESVRKPYVITNYMYGNSIEVALAENYKKEGLLKNIVYRSGDDGKDLFNHSCRSCHTIDGYRPLKPAFDGTDRAFIANMIKGIKALKGGMPPFLGTEEEANLMADYIYDRIDQRHLKEIYNLEGVELGKKVYDVRCGRCHVMGGYNDKSHSLVGMGEDGYKSLLDMAEMFGEEMPPFTGDETERKALIQYLMTLKEKK